MTAVSWPINFPDVISGRTVDELQAHPAFAAAKRGDFDAAVEVVNALAENGVLEKLRRDYRRAELLCVYVPSGNALPLAFAEWMSRETGMSICQSVQKCANAPSHTSRGATNRFARRVSFEVRTGHPAPRGKYVLVDDVCTQGGTISELRQFVIGHGGRVMGVAALSHTDSTAMSNGRRLAPTADTLDEIEARHGLANVGRILGRFGIYGGNAGAMTESELRLVLRYDTLDAFEREIQAERRGATVRRI